MLRCDRILVEGHTDKVLLEKIISYRVEIEVLGGKGKVINVFKNIKSVSVPLKKGSIFFIIDGDEGGYDDIFNSLKDEISDLVKEPPYIKKCIGELCYVLIVIGDEKDNYKGCVESLLLKELLNYSNMNTEKIIENIIEYKAIKK
ncbi:hypothetical protein [Stygiolobus caldivivus]|uniref:Uncharacterized protein n=1 Tax=Stygiolobus caldivivus TaxID=2824673 RepID=A0A8D5U5B9_9CREN|nr:hypothetical protein [Stygiolobus caldivivus]BCU69573.1 hypothetical protein KN1_08700 [Stygiolobus caldivivus]